MKGSTHRARTGGGVHEAVAWGSTMSSTRSDVGNLLQETEPKGTLTADPDDYATTYRYDDLNQVLEARDATLLVRTH